MGMGVIMRLWMEMGMSKGVSMRLGDPGDGHVVFGHGDGLRDGKVDEHGNWHINGH